MYFDTDTDCVNYVMIKWLVRRGEAERQGAARSQKAAQGEFLAKAARNSGEAR